MSAGGLESGVSSGDLILTRKLTSEQIEHGLTQYRVVNAQVIKLFREISLRTSEEPWKADGVGTCYGSKEFARTGEAPPNYKPDQTMIGPVADELIHIQDSIGKNTPGEREEDRSVCEFHRKGIGCILGEDKPPFCVSFIDNKTELEKRFEINGEELEDRLLEIVAKILQAGRKLTGDKWYYNPHVNDEFIPQASEEITGYIKQIQSFPILEDHLTFAIRDKNGVRRFKEEAVALEVLASLAQRRVPSVSLKTKMKNGLAHLKALVFRN